MNTKLFLNAMGDIEDTYIICAQKRLNHAPAKVLSIKRIFTVALAAVLVLLCTVAAAMAVSPEFREAVISLFQIGEVEQVPGIPAGANEVKQVTIGGEVSAQYVKVEGSWTGLLQWRDANEDQAFEGEQGRFYDVIDGELVEVGMDASEISTTLSWYGRNIDIYLRFFVYNEKLYLYNGTGGACYEGNMTFVVTPMRLGAHTDVVLLLGECYGSEANTNWAWVCDLKTGEVRDVLSGCGLETLGSARPILFTEDLRHALVRAGNDTAEGTPYLVDLEKKNYAPLGELMDLNIPETFGAYEIAFYDSDTLLLAMAPLWQPQPTSVWTYHIPSGVVTPTITEEADLQPITSANSYDWALVQKTGEDGTVTILDTHTGGRIKLEGITAEGNCYLKANPSQTKLLWVDWVDNDLNRLGVIDLETGEFTAFERESMELQYNEDVFWMDNNRVMTMMDLHTGEPSDSYSTAEYYLCIYEF